jgi:hypothetical protein
MPSFSSIFGPCVPLPAPLRDIARCKGQHGAGCRCGEGRDSKTVEPAGQLASWLAGGRAGQLACRAGGWVVPHGGPKRIMILRGQNCVNFASTAAAEGPASAA